MPLQSSNSFHHSGQRDDRRRRLLTDELSNSGDWPDCHIWPEDAPPPQKSPHYGDAEFLEQQLRLLDLVPRRIVSILSLLAVGAAILAGLEASYAWMIDRVADGRTAVTALDLAAKGSLGCWFSSLLLLAASAAAMLTYSVRRYRTDDYQGRYHIWLWAAACWFLMAADQAASLREAFRDLMIALTGTALVGDGALWWAIFYALVLGAVGSRLLMDMRSSRLAMTVFSAAALAHILAMAGRMGWIPLEEGSREVMFLAGAEIAGNMLLLAAMTLFARYVLLDAEGLLPRREPQPDDERAKAAADDDESESASSADDRWTKIDPPHTVPQPAYQRAAASPNASPTFSSSPTSTPVSSPINRKLTKGERKALKDRLLRERQERLSSG